MDFPFGKTKICLAISALLAPSIAFSAPIIGSGGVTSGSAAVVQSGSVTNVNQATDKATINWQSFGSLTGETINFNQPGTSSITLNRVIGNERSVLDGALNANGKVFLINGAGILFGRNSTVNAGGFVASTLNLSDDDFNAGRYTFKAAGTSGSVVNLGTITSAERGYVALLGNSVSNQGVITAAKGTVALSSGNKVTLNFNGDSLVRVTIDEGTLNGLVENRQAIYADGGQVIMTAKAADDLLSSQVNNSGLIQARTVGDLTGSIYIHAYGGAANIAGKLDASAPVSGDGGFIETSGSKVNISDSAVITTASAQGRTGTWLIDPDGYTIGQGGDMTGATLSGRLALNNVEIRSTNGSGADGNVTVNDAVSWSANILTLTATNNVVINNTLTATGTAGLEMNYGGNYSILTRASYSGAGMQPPANAQYGSIQLTGAGTTLKMNGQTYTLLRSMSDIAAISGPGKYALAQDLDASSTLYSAAVLANFSGTFAGLGNKISNLRITDTVNRNTGLFGVTAAGSLIRDLGLVNVNITGAASNGFKGVGALTGQNGADISHVYSTGVVTGVGYTGGLVGYNSGSGNAAVSNTISDSFSDAAVKGGNVGGLVGRADNLDILRSHATGNITAGANSGGLVGYAVTLNVTDSYATGDVTGPAATATGLGGLIGYMGSNARAQTIRNSYATGNISGAYQLGGLIGYVNITGGDFTIDNSYATGRVTGSQSQSSVFDGPGIGGLVGMTNVNFGAPYMVTIKNSHASGDVSFSSTFGTAAGGLVGNMVGKSLIDNSYATGNVNGAPSGTSAGGLVGTGTATDINNSYASGNVSGNRSVGGLAGGNSGTISNSYASGNVTGNNNVGGLVGSNSASGTVRDSYTTGNVRGLLANSETGGVVGINSGLVSGVYSTGVISRLSGNPIVGGVVGGNINNGRVLNSYFNKTLNPDLDIVGVFPNITQGTVIGGGGLTSTQMSDVKFYQDGTINQVLADRAAAQQALADARAAQQARADQQAKADAQAALQERVEEAGVRTDSVARNVQKEAGNELPKSTTADLPPPVDSRVTFADSDNSSADVESISVDGVKFDVNEARKPGAGSGASPGK